MGIADIPDKYEATANDFARYNLLNNGGFDSFPGTTALVENVNPAFSGGTTTPKRTFIDQKQYRFTSFSFAPAEEAGLENRVGSWDVYGVKGSVEVAPTDASTGFSVFARDGGNFARVTFSAAGSIYFEQDFSDLAKLRGQPIMLAYSGAAGKNNVTINMRLLDGEEEVFSTRDESSTFGQNRRIVRQVDIPATAASLKFQLELVGTVGSRCSISSITSVLGPTGNTLPFVPSICDVTVPSGLVILFEGDACPPGFRDAMNGAEAMLLGVNGEHAIPDADGQAQVLVGNDEHDHNPEGPPDAFGDASSVLHETPIPIPFGSQAFVRTPLFGTLPQFPGEQPAEVLGTRHTHKLTTKMTSVPPSFPVRACIKL